MTHTRLAIFTLGYKGYTVLKRLIESDFPLTITCILSEDKNLAEDYCEEISTYCKQHNISIYPRNHVHTLKDYDLIFAVGWRWLIKDVMQRLIVFHDSLLPQYRGFAPVVNALLNKEPHIGVTALLASEEYDAGNILFQKRIAVTYPTTIEDEINRISCCYGDIAEEIIDAVLSGKISKDGIPQDKTKITYSLWRDNDDYRIDWNKNDLDILHFISCVGYPYLGASTECNGRMLRIFSAQKQQDVVIENRTPGKVIFLEDRRFPVVVCGKGLLKLTDVRYEDGRSALPLRTFRSRFR